MAGSTLLVAFSGHEELLEKIMGGVILFAGIPLLYFRNMGLKARKRPLAVKIVEAVLLMFGIILQAALGAGVGMLQLIVLIGCFGMTALVASATRGAIQLVVATISLTIFMPAGLVDYQFGLVALVTSSIGGFIGTHVAVKRGDRFIINLFAIVSAVLALQLLL